jgi:DTW domain-containing protein YfiP
MPRRKGTPPSNSTQATAETRERIGRERAYVARLRAAGASNDEIFATLTEEAVARKEAGQKNRCRRCWHDRAQHCICDRLAPLRTALNVRVLVLMHSSEYLSPGDDAKLLLAMLPAEQAGLYVFGRRDDMAALRRELHEDPTHTLLLWPGEEALTVEQFTSQLPADSAWRATPSATSGAAAAPPLLRVVVLDGTYNAARSMFRHFKKHLQPSGECIHEVALHPNTMSVYHRAQSNYAAASSEAIAREGADPLALRICTVEAFALLLQELGEPDATTKAFVAGVLANNDAVGASSTAKETAPRAGGPARERRGHSGWLWASMWVAVGVAVCVAIGRSR